MSTLTVVRKGAPDGAINMRGSIFRRSPRMATGVLAAGVIAALPGTAHWVPAAAPAPDAVAAAPSAASGVPGSIRPAQLPAASATSNPTAPIAAAAASGAMHSTPSPSAPTPPSRPAAGAGPRTAPAAGSGAPRSAAAPAGQANAAAAPSGFVYRCGTQLCLDGQVWNFTGVNAYEAATDWGVNDGCGTDLSNSDLDTLFSSLGPGHVVRFWAFQALATNATTKQLDWAPIDRVITTAAAYGDMVIPALAGESGNCDDNHWKDIAWYAGGYMNVYDSNQWPASTPLSYWNYMQDFLSRYKANPTIAMIELISEPAPTDSGYVCVNEAQAASALRSFYDTVGAAAHSIDPNHLIESGSQGVGQCGQQDEGCTTSSWTSCSIHDYEYTEDSPNVDVASYHDYVGSDTQPSQYLTISLAEATAIGKPLVVGESGIEAQAALAGCMNYSTRAQDLSAKIVAEFDAGADGFLAWDWVPSNPGGGNTCSYDIGPTDPLMAVLARNLQVWGSTPLELIPGSVLNSGAQTQPEKLPSMGAA